MIILICFFVIIDKFEYDYISTKKIIITIMFIMLDTIMLLLYKKLNRKILIYIIGFFVFIEITLNGILVVRQLGNITRESFINSYQENKPVVEKYKSDNTNFYRMEMDTYRTVNDSMLYNYASMHHYSSTSGKENKKFLTNFGIRNNLVQENQTNTSIPMSTLLGIKYYMMFDNLNNETKNQENYAYNLIDKIGNIRVYENKYYLPLGIAVNKNVLDYQQENNINTLYNQNSLLKVMSNTDLDVFSTLNSDKYSIDLDNIEYDQYNNHYIIKDKSKYGTISIKVNSLTDMYFSYIGNFYSMDNVDIKLGNLIDYTISETNQYNHLYLPKGQHSIQIKLKNNCKWFKFSFISFNKDAYEKIFNILNSCPKLDIEKNNIDYIKGRINIKDNNILYTSIIFDKGWQVKVNGKNKEPILIADSLLGIELEKGENIVELKYYPRGFFIGITTSTGTLFIIIVYLFIKRYKNKY